MRISVSPYFVRGSFFLALILGLCGLPCLSGAQENHAHHWDYAGPEDPPHWGKLDPTYAECSLGHMQSPIDIKQAKKTELPALKIDYKPGSLNIIDNGHTVQINIAPGSTLTVGSKSYTLKQFHFHHPSEEHVNGKVYDLVAHLVHVDRDGHLAVVAVLFDKGNANPLIETLWKNVPAEKEKARDFPSVSIQVQDLLPAERGYFTYTGSLTTPPCSEGVTWYVLKNPSTVSAGQVAAFSRIYPRNARPIQPTDGREILQSK
jgi:carbonic anhydrase